MNQNINDDIIINMYVTDKKRINSNLVRHINDVKYKAYKEYLLNRYDDIDLNNFTYKEIIWRIYLKQEKRNRCPICNNYTPYNYSKLILKEQSVYRKYCCSSCAAKSKERNIKYKETNISKYGVPYVLLTEEVVTKFVYDDKYIKILITENEEHLKYQNDKLLVIHDDFLVSKNAPIKWYVYFYQDDIKEFVQNFF